jgi:hypothetical protein
MANRIFEDPDSDPEQDPYRLVSAGVDHPGLLLLIHPRPVILLTAVKDFFPIEGARKTFREVRALYRRFGHGDRIAMAEGVHGHMYSPENRRAAFAFMDRFNRQPARHALDPITILDPAALRCTPTGQVRVDLPGRSLPEVIREEWRGRARPRVSLADLYRSEGNPQVARWPVVPKGPAPAVAGIAWEAAGTSRVGDVSIDRYRLHHSDHLLLPVLHIHRETTPRGRVVLALSLEGKLGASDWPAVLQRLDAGEEVVTFDFRGVGETGMRYRAASGDDPTLAEADERRAYFSPLSGVLANHVYNSLLTGRPYILEMIDDVAIVARFARQRLGAARVTVADFGNAGLLADAIPGVLRDVSASPSAGPRALRWAELVEEMRELWPIQYLMPKGALLTPDLAPAER